MDLILCYSSIYLFIYLFEPEGKGARSHIFGVFPTAMEEPFFCRTPNFDLFFSLARLRIHSRLRFLGREVGVEAERSVRGREGLASVGH